MGLNKQPCLEPSLRSKKSVNSLLYTLTHVTHDLTSADNPFKQFTISVLTLCFKGTCHRIFISNCVISFLKINKACMQLVSTQHTLHKDLIYG